MNTIDEYLKSNNSDNFEAKFDGHEELKTFFMELLAYFLKYYGANFHDPDIKYIFNVNYEVGRKNYKNLLPDEKRASACLKLHLIYIKTYFRDLFLYYFEIEKQSPDLWRKIQKYENDEYDLLSLFCVLGANFTIDLTEHMRKRIIQLKDFLLFWESFLSHAELAVTRKQLSEAKKNEFDYQRLKELIERSEIKRKETSPKSEVESYINLPNIVINGESFTLPYQASEFVRLLIEEHKKGAEHVYKRNVLDSISDFPESAIELFRRSPEAKAFYKKFVRHDTKGNYWLTFKDNLS